MMLRGSSFQFLIPLKRRHQIKMFYACYNKVEVGIHTLLANRIKLYFICVTYGLPYFSFRFVSLRFFSFLFFFFRFVSFLTILFSFFCVSFFFVSFRYFSPCFLFVFFLSVSFRFFSFFSVSQFTGTPSSGRQITLLFWRPSDNPSSYRQITLLF